MSFVFLVFVHKYIQTNIYIHILESTRIGIESHIFYFSIYSNCSDNIVESLFWISDIKSSNQFKILWYENITTELQLSFMLAGCVVFIEMFWFHINIFRFILFKRKVHLAFNNQIDIIVIHKNS